MKPARWGFGLRSSILIVAAFALGMWAERLRTKRGFYLERAARFADLERQDRELLGQSKRFQADLLAQARKADEGGDRKAAGRIRLMLAHEQVLMRRAITQTNALHTRAGLAYQEAARAPWREVDSAIRDLRP